MPPTQHQPSCNNFLASSSPDTHGATIIRTMKWFAALFVAGLVCIRRLRFCSFHDTCKSNSASSSRLFETVAPSEPSSTTIKSISYGEESRKYRRTVYTHDDWRKHRRSDRFIYYLGSIFSSGVYKSLAREVTATTGIAALLCLYNAAVGGYVDLEGVTAGCLGEFTIASSLWTLTCTLYALESLSWPITWYVSNSSGRGGLYVLTHYFYLQVTVY